METSEPDWTAAEENLLNDLKSNKNLYIALREWISKSSTDKEKEDFKKVDNHKDYIDGDKYILYNLREACTLYKQGLSKCIVDKLRINYDNQLICRFEDGRPSIPYWPSLNWVVGFGVTYAVIKSIKPSSDPLFFHSRGENDDKICDWLLQRISDISIHKRNEIVRLVEDHLSEDNENNTSSASSKAIIFPEISEENIKIFADKYIVPNEHRGARSLFYTLPVEELLHRIYAFTKDWDPSDASVRKWRILYEVLLDLKYLNVHNRPKFNLFVKNVVKYCYPEVKSSFNNNISKIKLSDIKDCWEEDEKKLYYSLQDALRFA